MSVVASRLSSLVETTSLSASPQLEDALRHAVRRLAAPPCAPRLASALGHAVFPGGARVRPRLCLAVAEAFADPAAGLAPAVAVELFHCASLVHDDLPCFDDALTRRGRPSVHAKYGSATAVLVGDALLVGGFEVLARDGAAAREGVDRGALVGVFAGALGSVRGLIGGQAWEAEAAVDIGHYHRAKTGALFEAACVAGALAAGADGERLRPVGAALGCAYQILDDLLDATPAARGVGKPTGVDAARGRPNAVHAAGAAAAARQAAALVDEACARVPPDVPGRAGLVALVRAIADGAWGRAGIAM